VRRGVRIIEIKPKETAGVTKTADEFVSWHLRPGMENRLNRYRKYGTPVDLVHGMEGAKQYLAWARNRGSPR
jgi:hypothetical protein